LDKRYQIFVSSTFTDLQDERQAVMQALLNFNHFPAGMELFPASDEDQWALIKGIIDDSDYYIIVIAARYGSVSADGISYTEREFDYAASRDIPILAFLHENPADLPAKNSDLNDELRLKLEGLRLKVQEKRHVKFWRTASDLQTKVTQAVAAETKRNPRIGWIRADQVGDPTRLNELAKENDALKATLARVRTLPSQGTAEYAQGKDKFAIAFWVKTSYNSVQSWQSTELTWDQIFYYIGPMIYDGCADGDLELKFSAYLKPYSKIANIYSLGISRDHFETIKIQLIALELMIKSAKKHNPGDARTYWCITPFGEQQLTRLRAIKNTDAK
jgi:hypothetical protein